MPPVETTFRPVDPDILNYLERSIQQHESDRARTVRRIKSVRHRAARALLCRANALRNDLRRINAQDLSEARLRMEEEQRIRAEALLADLNTQAQKTVESVLREILGTDRELATRAALRRLASILTLLSRQHELTVTFNPEQFDHPSVKEFCAEHQLNAQAELSCMPGDLQIKLPAGIIESPLSEDVQMLIEHLGACSPSLSAGSVQSHA